MKTPIKNCTVAELANAVEKADQDVARTAETLRSTEAAYVAAQERNRKAITAQTKAKRSLSVAVAAWT